MIPATQLHATARGVGKAATAALRTAVASGIEARRVETRSGSMRSTKARPGVSRETPALELYCCESDQAIAIT